MPQVLMFTIIKVDINYWMCMMIRQYLIVPEGKEETGKSG